MKKILFICLILSFGCIRSMAQEYSFFAPADTFSQQRFNMMLSLGVSTYVATSTGLYFAWYANYPQSKFHLFNDGGEWLDMDKNGHVYSAYFQSLLCYKGAKWTGLSEDNSILTGMLCAGLFQSTIEVMDGFSEKWGFSIPDFAANATGITLFALQQKYWKEQRITMKLGLFPASYGTFDVIGSNGTVQSSAVRRDALFGASTLERYLKDYNSQSYWLSFDVHSFLPEDNQWPEWLNLSIGYGGENMYGGYANSWEVDGERFTVDSELYPRTRQFYIGLDWNLNSINTRNKFLKGLLDVLDIFHLPAPAVEINTQGHVVFHLLR